MAIDHVQLVIRLVVSAALAGFIGLERESHGHPAGLRTHILVAVGSSLVMLLSIYGFGPEWAGRDPSRMAAQVISGIGFLGAGTILREGASVKGLTTAASLWVSAGIGLAIGSGFYLGGALATILAVSALFVLEKVEKRFISPRSLRIEAVVSDRPGRLGEICSIIGCHGFSIRAIDLERDEPREEVTVSIQVESKGPGKTEELLADLHKTPGLRRLVWR